MKIVADQDIPHIANAFRHLGETRLLPGREISRSDLRDCQCLVVRTVTRVDAALLEDTPVEFVASATIGTDHVDLEYLARAQIQFSNAAGCNAEAAAEYVVSGLFMLGANRGFEPAQRHAGIVGYGNVGKRLCRLLELLGVECLVCDPPLAESGSREREFVALDTLLQECDLLSLHVPLTRTGTHASWHLLGATRLQKLRPGCLLINAARGEIVDNRALGELLTRRPDLLVFLDTWEDEPLVSQELLQRVDIATPHIAGYSVEGRLRGTQMVLDAACAHFGVTPGWHMRQEIPPQRQLRTRPSASVATAWQELFRQHWDIRHDHTAFTEAGDLEDPPFARHFDRLRRVYAERREYQQCIIEQPDPLLSPATLQALGFRLGE